MKHLKELRRRLAVYQHGQSLVEMAIITPILIIMFIGVFEVGWALRGYLVLANTNRETVRYAVKNGVLDYSTKDPTAVGYDKVLSHTIDSLAGQLPLEFGADANTTLIISHFVIDTGFPCAVKLSTGEPKVPYEFDPSCDCGVTDPNAAQWFTLDDLVAFPNAEYPHYAITYGLSRTTRLAGGNYADYAQQLKVENNRLNCAILQTSASSLSLATTANNLLVAEAFYDQPQLLGVPFISNPLTDPIPFYAHTAMRIVTSREADTTNSVGPVCEVYPMAYSQSLFDPSLITGTTGIDANQDSSGFGWLNWNPAKTDEIYVQEELLNPRLAMNDFTGLTPGLAPDGSNKTLNAGDWVSGQTTVSSSYVITTALKELVGKTIRVPVYSNTSGSSPMGYLISRFALLTVNQICWAGECAGFSGSQKMIRATFEGYDDQACQ